MLLVVVDQARIRRRGDDRVEAAPGARPRARRRGATAASARPAHARELLEPRQRVERVAAEEVRRRARPDGTRAGACGTSTARAAARAGKSRSKWVVRRADRAARARTTRSTSACSYSSISDRNARARRRPAARTTLRRSRSRLARRRASPRSKRRERVAQVVLERERVVAPRLHAHQQAVERGDVDAGRVEAALERLDERRPRAGERVEHAAARRRRSGEELLDELRDELAEVRVEPVDVLRPLPLGELLLRPRELEVEPGVERVLGRHADARHEPPSCAQNASRTRSSRRPRTAMTSKRTMQPAHSRWTPSHASAARRTRRTFSGRDHLERVAEAPSRSSTSPRRRRPSAPRRATRSSSLPATQTFVPRMR